MLVLAVTRRLLAATIYGKLFSRAFNALALLFWHAISLEMKSRHPVVG